MPRKLAVTVLLLLAAQAHASTVILTPAVDPPETTADAAPPTTPFPTGRPTTAFPTRPPTNKPTSRPTRSPTLFPTKRPTLEPSAFPTRPPTNKPTLRPTASPTTFPTKPTTAAPNDDDDDDDVEVVEEPDECQALTTPATCASLPTCSWVDISFVIPPDMVTKHEFNYGCRRYDSFCDMKQGTVLQQQFQCGSRPRCMWNAHAKECLPRTARPTVDGTKLPAFCADSCDFCTNNGVCEDGGPGSVVGGLCFPGSDCSDCGPGDRTEAVTPKREPQPNAHCVGTIG